MPKSLLITRGRHDAACSSSSPPLALPVERLSATTGYALTGTLTRPTRGLSTIARSGADRKSKGASTGNAWRCQLSRLRYMYLKLA